MTGSSPKENIIIHMIRHSANFHQCFTTTTVSQCMKINLFFSLSPNCSDPNSRFYCTRCRISYQLKNMQDFNVTHHRDLQYIINRVYFTTFPVHDIICRQGFFSHFLISQFDVKKTSSFLSSQCVKESITKQGNDCL